MPAAAAVGEGAAHPPETVIVVDPQPPSAMDEAPYTVLEAEVGPPRAAAAAAGGGKNGNGESTATGTGDGAGAERSVERLVDPAKQLPTPWQLWRFIFRDLLFGNPNVYVS